MVEQLPVVVAKVSRPYTGGSLADAIDIRGETVLRATARGLGFSGRSNCLGAPTTTPGSEVTPATRGSVCDIAGPMELHSDAVNRMATAEGATRLDDILMTRSPKSKHRTTYPTSRSVRVGIMPRRSHAHLPRSRQCVRSNRVFAVANRTQIPLQGSDCRYGREMPRFLPSKRPSR